MVCRKKVILNKLKKLLGKYRTCDMFMTLGMMTYPLGITLLLSNHFRSSLEIV